eukprot:Skav232227  [mRNA]  locus=scaffold286:290428:295796:- [translate_table: standard]
MSVRSSVVSHLKRHESRYKPWWDKKNPNGETGTTWENYLKLLNKNMAWGGAMEIAAAAAHFDRAIHVLGPHMVHSEVYNRNAKGEPICLWFRKEHYEWLKGKTPASILAGENCNGPLQGGRGGSVESASCSGVTRLSALPESKRPSEGRSVNVKSAVKSAGGRTRVSALPQQPASVSTPRFGEVSVAPSDEAIAAITRSCIAKPRRQGRIVEWICPYCKVTITGKNLYNRKKDHLKAWHPDKRQEARLVQTLQVQEVHDTDVYWKCPLCSCGLTHEQSQANNVSRLREAMLRHKKAKHDKAPMKGFSFKAGVRVKESLKRAHAAVRNKAAMSRILKGKSSKHQVTFFKWPVWWNNRENRQDVLCSRCKRLARSVQELDKSECKVDSSFIGRRQALLNKLQELLIAESADRAPQLKEMILQLTFNEQRAVGDHEMSTFVKPTWMKLPRADNTFCIKCKRLACMYKSLADIPCEPLPAFRRKRLFDNMAKTAGRNKTRRKEMKQLMDLLSTGEPAGKDRTPRPVPRPHLKANRLLTFQERKLNKFRRQLLEYQVHCRRGRFNPQLRNNLWRRWTQLCVHHDSLQSLDFADPNSIGVIEQCISNLEQRAQNDRLQAWQNRISQSDAALFQWVRREASDSVFTDGVPLHPQAKVEHFQNEWQRMWNRCLAFALQDYLSEQSSEPFVRWFCLCFLTLVLGISKDDLQRWRVCIERAMMTPVKSRSRLLLWACHFGAHLDPEFVMDFSVIRHELWKLSPSAQALRARASSSPRLREVLSKWHWQQVAPQVFATPFGLLNLAWDGLATIRRFAILAWERNLWFFEPRIKGMDWDSFENKFPVLDTHKTWLAARASHRASLRTALGGAMDGHTLSGQLGCEVACRCGWPSPSRQHLAWRCPLQSSCGDFDEPANESELRLCVAAVDFPSPLASRDLDRDSLELVQHLRACPSRLVATDASVIGKWRATWGGITFNGVVPGLDLCSCSAEEVYTACIVARASNLLDIQLDLLTDSQFVTRLWARTLQPCFYSAPWRVLKDANLRCHWVPSHGKHLHWRHNSLDENLCRLLNERADNVAGLAQAHLSTSLEDSINHCAKWSHFALERLCQASVDLVAMYSGDSSAA